MLLHLEAEHCDAVHGFRADDLSASGQRSEDDYAHDIAPDDDHADGIEAAAEDAPHSPRGASWSESAAHPGRPLLIDTPVSMLYAVADVTAAHSLVAEVVESSEMRMAARLRADEEPHDDADDHDDDHDDAYEPMFSEAFDYHHEDVDGAMPLRDGDSHDHTQRMRGSMRELQMTLETDGTDWDPLMHMPIELPVDDFDRDAGYEYIAVPGHPGLSALSVSHDRHRQQNGRDTPSRADHRQRAEQAPATDNGSRPRHGAPRRTAPAALGPDTARSSMGFAVPLLRKCLADNAEQRILQALFVQDLLLSALRGPGAT